MKLFFTILLASALYVARGVEEGKCGCCPEPCCCVCVTNEIPGPTLPPTTTTSSTSTSTSTTSTSTTSTSTSTEFIPECNSTQEISFIIDASGSISPADWIVAKQFVKNIIQQFRVIGESGTRVSMTTFSTNATVHWNLDSPETMSRGALLSAVDALERGGRFTNTPAAMQQTISETLEGPGNEPDVPNVIIVITDGMSTHSTSQLPGIAVNLQTFGTVLAIGVTNETSQSELNDIASGDGDENTFNVDQFDELETILATIVEKSCTEFVPLDRTPRPPRTPRPTRPARTTRPTRTPVPTNPPIITEECFCCCPPPPGRSYLPNLQKPGCGC